MTSVLILPRSEHPAVPPIEFDRIPGQRRLSAQSSNTGGNRPPEREEGRCKKARHPLKLLT